MSYSHIINKSILIFLVFLAFPVLALKVPSGAHVFAPFKSVEPVIDTIAASTQPIGLGNVANNGDTFSLKVNLKNFTNPVDLYLALFVPELDSQNIYLVTNPLGVQPHSVGMVPWKSNVLSVNETLFGEIPIALLPQSRYSVILLAVPAGTSVPNLVDNFYLWSSSFSTLDLIDLSNEAVTQHGGGAEAATAILLALDSGHSLENIIQAILANSLTGIGGINDKRAVQQKNTLPKICDRYENIQKCKNDVKEIFLVLISGLKFRHLSDSNLEIFVTAMTILASNKGYSSSQIHEALSSMLLTGTITIDENGYIWKNCSTILCQNIDRKKVEPIDPIGELIEFLESFSDDESSNESSNTDMLPDYGLSGLFDGICGPLVRSSYQRNKVSFDFGTCPSNNTVPGFEGKWYNTQWGVMDLVQTGSEVNGSYAHEAGKIEGTVIGNVLCGTWKETPSFSPPDDAGSFEFTLSEDGSSFIGKWRYGISEDCSAENWNGDWNSTRQQ